ncbi:MAG: DJ-1/PfpI family protein [Leptotrichiaceae bacterium]|nr:DJ-1/PfpI family protein [Leptotrichiaceae bacterium]
MKKTAVLIYNSFCNFEFSVLLEILAMNEKPITVFSKDIFPVRSEEGITVLPDKKISDLDINEYDSLILTGAYDIRETVEDDEIMDFIRKFNTENYVIGAISIAPILLLKAGLLKDKKFIAGVNKEELYEEGFQEKELKYMIDWNEALKNPMIEGYVKDRNIITAVSYNFIKWAMAIIKELGLNVSPKSFGL